MKKLIVIIQLAVLLVSCTGNKKTTTLNTSTALNPNIVSDRLAISIQYRFVSVSNIPKTKCKQLKSVPIRQSQTV